MTAVMLASPTGVQTDIAGPTTHDFHKRAIQRSAPRRFEVISLPPKKFGKTYCFGLQIYPICPKASVISNLSSPYEIWRTWDDCLWFQDLMETRYGFIAHAKRQRLQAGKGVKKNGMYIHDRAASFESLPPGPDPKSVAKDLHQCLPKLTSRGSFFGASQATVDQRQKEFSAFIKAFFEEDVPTLIKDLRDDPVIRDFFGYWRRDYDLALKNSKGSQRPKTAPSGRDSVRNMSFISSFFSSSNVSLSSASSRASTVLPSTPSRSASLSHRSHMTDSTLSLPDADSVLSATSKPRSSAPASLGPTFRDSVTSDDEDPIVRPKISTSFSSRYSSSPPSSPSSHKTASSSRRPLSNRSKNSPSPRSETFNVTSDFPLFLSSSTRDMLPATRPPHSPGYATPALETLPEDSVPDSPVSNTPRLTLRGRSDLPVNTKRANRNVVILPDTDEVSSSEGDVHEGELLTPVDGADFSMIVGRSTSCSSPPPSSTLSDFSSQSDGSSWRTFSEHTWPSSASSNDSESGHEIDFPHMTCTDSFAELEVPLSPPAASSSISTLPGSLYNRRRRSLSQPLPVGSSIPMDVGEEEEDWSDQGEDLMETYLGGSQSIFAPSVRDSLSNYDDVPSDFPLDIPDDASVISFSTTLERVPSIHGPPRATHRPRPSWTTSSTRPPSSRLSRSMSISSSCVSARDDTLVVKAALDDAKVVLRVQRDVPLAELRQRVLEKFAQTEGTMLSGEFELAYLPPVVGASGVGKNRASTFSSMSTTSVATVDWANALPLRNERDWAAASASCGPKITLLVTYPPSQ